MDCETCTDRMIELLYEELDESEANATRAHLEGCEACGDAWDRLSLGHAFGSRLALEEPPTDFRAAVMRAAREKAAERAPAADPDPVDRAAPVSAPREDADEAGLWASFVRWVGGSAMRPQFAMAMTLVLMVGIGLWYLPELRRHDPADTHAIVDPAPGDEVGPSASLEPAEPLELRTDPHTGRIVTGDEGEEERPRRVATTEATSAQAPRPEAEAPGATHDDLAVDEAETPTEMAQAEERAAERQGQVIEEPMLDMAEGAEALLAQGESYGSGSYGAEGSARPPSPPPSQARTAPAYAREAQTAPMPSVRQPSVQQQPSPAPTAPQQRQQASTGGAGERYQLGMDHYRGRRYRAAAEEFEAVVRRPGPDRSLVPSALHHLARSLREAGDCRAAVRSYDNLLSQHGSYRGAPDAMIEAADCYRRLGQLSQARRLLERASQNAGVAARAQRELSRLAVAEREHRRASQAGAAAEAAPAEAEAAAADEN